jgi:hypothetical protein
VIVSASLTSRSCSSPQCTIDTCDGSRPLTDLCVYTPKPCEDGNKCNGIMACDEATGTCFEEKPAVNCDDSNACTIGKCDPSEDVSVIRLSV